MDNNIHCEINIKVKESSILKMTESEINQKGEEYKSVLREIQKRALENREADMTDVNRHLCQQIEILAEMSKECTDKMELIRMSETMVDIAQIVNSPVQKIVQPCLQNQHA